MLIGNKWKIEADQTQYILSKKKNRENRDTAEKYIAWEIYGYYSNLAYALQDLVELEVRDTQLTDLKTVIARVKEVADAIRTSLEHSTALQSGTEDKTGKKIRKPRKDSLK